MENPRVEPGHTMGACCPTLCCYAYALMYAATRMTYCMLLRVCPTEYVLNAYALLNAATRKPYRGDQALQAVCGTDLAYAPTEALRKERRDRVVPGARRVGGRQ
eukprot:3941138-Rhodomonas_salina.1